MRCMVDNCQESTRCGIPKFIDGVHIHLWVCLEHYTIMTDYKKEHAE